MKILFLCDIDGTLVNGHFMSEKIKSRVEEFTAKGNLFTLATGRNAFAMKWLCRELPINAPCILLAGAAQYDPIEDKLLHLKAMPEDTAASLKEMYDAYPDMTIQVFTDAGLTNLRYGPFMQANGIPEERAMGEGPASELEGRKILKIGLTNEKVEQIPEAIGRWFGNKKYYDWHMSFVIGAEIVNPDASKGRSVEEILADMDEKPDLIAAAGDSPNDLPLFETADICFAPEDAFQEIKDKADYIIPTANDGGIADAIDILIKKYCQGEK